MSRPSEGQGSFLSARQALDSIGQEPLVSDHDFGGQYHDSFYNNLKLFAERKGKFISLPGSGKCWKFELRDGTQLYVYEEVITAENFSCDQCRIIGWGTHPVCKTKYHFIIPAETGPDSVEDKESLAAITESCRTGRRHEHAIRLPSKTTNDDRDHHASSYNAEPTIYDSARHRLHGVIHANGFGHLLRVNGKYGGARATSGLQIFALWDVLCLKLKAREITVEDVSSKAGMELRISYFIAYGQTWYGLLGYDFGRGPYNISEVRWRDAGTWISSALISHLLQDFEGVDDALVSIVHRYCLPVGKAAHVRDFGALLYRLLYLQLNPEESLQFFDNNALQAARESLATNLTAPCQSGVKRKGKKKPSKFTSLKRRMIQDDKTIVKQEICRAGGPAKRQVGTSRGSQSVNSESKVGTLQPGRKKTFAINKEVNDLNNSDLLKIGDHIEVLLRGNIEPCEVVAVPVNRGRMHRVEFKSNKTRKIDLVMTPWRFAGAGPLNMVCENALEVLEKKEEAKMETIKNSKHNSMNPAVLKYKANLSREDFVERSRQLCRAIKALIPGSKTLIGPAKTRVEMEAAFTALVDGDGPVVTCTNSWWEYLPALLQWARDLIGLEDCDPADCIKVVDNTIEIDRDSLHRMGLYPEGWRVPLQQETLILDNEAYRSKAADGLSFGDKHTIDKPANGTKSSLEVYDATEASGFHKTRSAVRRLTTREPVSVEAGDNLRNQYQNGTEASTIISKEVKKVVDATMDAIWQAMWPDREKNGQNMPQHQWHLLAPGADICDPQDTRLAKWQVTRDLHHIFNCVLKVYLPEIAKIAAQNVAVLLGVRSPSKTLKLKQMSQEVRILRDTKHFIKQYWRTWESDAAFLARTRQLSFSCQLQVPPELNEPSTSNTRFGRKFIMVQPPPETILVAKTATSSQLLTKCGSVFSNLYWMCDHFHATGLSPLDITSEGRKRPSSSNHFIPNAKMEFLASQLGTTMFLVAGKKFDIEANWLHAGGPEDWIVNCPCGTRDDDGEAMVACDICETWMHTRCVNVPDDTQAWACQNCRKK